MAKANSTIGPKVWEHKGSGKWCLTRKGRRYYLGASEKEAIDRYNRYASSIERGLAIPKLGEDPAGDGDSAATVQNITLAFLESQKLRVASGELSQRSLTDYARSCRDFCKTVGGELWAADLSPQHFNSYRSDVADRRNLVSVGNEVTRIKTVFKWAYGNDLLENPPKFGTDFKRPKKSDVRKFRRGQPKKTLTTAEILLLLAELGVHERAMALLGINAGFGNSDCSTLLLSEIDFTSGELDAIRPKTGESRFCTLWPETLEALRLSLEYRNQPKDKSLEGKFFVTFDGRAYVEDSSDKSINDMVSTRTTAAMQRLKIHEPGKSFYWLRHTFRTIANEIGDDKATAWIMGHVRDDTADTYVHDAPKERIKKITDHVRGWLFGKRLAK